MERKTVLCGHRALYWERGQTAQLRQASAREASGGRRLCKRLEMGDGGVRLGRGHSVGEFWESTDSGRTGTTSSDGVLAWSQDGATLLPDASLPGLVPDCQQRDACCLDSHKGVHKHCPVRPPPLAWPLSTLPPPQTTGPVEPVVPGQQEALCPTPTHEQSLGSGTSVTSKLGSSKGPFFLTVGGQGGVGRALWH